MPLKTLSPHKFLKVHYGPVRGNRLYIDISAERAIDVHTVAQHDFQQWRSKREFLGSSFLRRKNLSIAFNSGPEFEDDWYLVLENISNEPIAVEYEVSER